jgi:uncharacterized membrane protein
LFAVALYDVAKALHILAVVGAFGLPLAYPLLVPYARRAHPQAMPAVHDIQYRLNQRVTAPGTVLILLFGAYMASKEDLWGETWVTIPLIILLAIAGIGGALVVPATKRLAELARRDLTRAEAPGDTVSFSADYDREYRRYLQLETLLGALVIVAVVFMTTKP